jgi:alpha-mannosidase
VTHVVIETVKPAEDGSGDIVVRLYEAMRTATRATLSTSLPVRRATVVNMLEEKIVIMASGPRRPCVAGEHNYS